ncbi:MAG: hypothetical protein AB8G26_10160, partial [Ilumatobacter sp.]
EARASDPIAERKEQASRPRRPRAETPPSPPVEIALESLGDATPIAVRATVRPEIGCADEVRFVHPLPEPEITTTGGES